MLITAVSAQEPSTCYGTTSNGALENGWKLPADGQNFSAYSLVGSLAGRTFVHSDVHAVVIESYAALARSMPDKIYVYGETGKMTGGEFRPHKTHQNGLSVDFMVPVADRSGRSIRLPTGVFNRWGYDLEFDADGRLDDIRIDAEAMAEHLYELDRSAKRRGMNIRRVIFDPELQPLLRGTSRWPYLRDNLRFSERRSWVRHDEHYHVDFDVACRGAI